MDGSIFRPSGSVFPSSSSSNASSSSGVSISSVFSLRNMTWHMDTMAISAERRSSSESRAWQHMLSPVSIISQTLSSPRTCPPGPDIMPSISFNMRSSTISSAAESLASKRQCVMAEESCCIASGSRGESWPITPYDRNLVMAMRASEVIGADVEEERMTWRKGCSIDGVSKVLISDTALAWLRSTSRHSTRLCSPSDRFGGAQTQT